MILSFHPLFQGDLNIVCAGRPLNGSDLRAIRAADAVILPQGCDRELYRAARENCPLVFPNYDVRFEYPGKAAQIRLFQDTATVHPRTEIYSEAAEYFQKHGRYANKPPFEWPFVFKFDWGGEGETVHRVGSEKQLRGLLRLAETYEGTGQKGFMLQELIFSNRTLRVAVIGRRRISYWRVQPDPKRFTSGIAAGGTIDHQADPHLQAVGKAAVGEFCKRTSVNLAGIDLLFPDPTPGRPPYFIEVNYFFGRRGLGGSGKYYSMLLEEIRNWLADSGLGPGDADEPEEYR